MPKTFDEGALQLEIDARRAIKWDDHPAFRNGLARRDGTKAVDLCADIDGEGPVYIEIKDFRASAIENQRRLDSGELAHEVAEKVRDTLAGLVWACKRGIGESFHEHLTRDYLLARKARVILWLEEDQSDVAGASALQDRIREELRPHISAKVIVTSSQLEKLTKHPIAWLRVKSQRSTRIATAPRRGKPRRRKS